MVIADYLYACPPQKKNEKRERRKKEREKGKEKEKELGQNEIRKKSAVWKEKSIQELKTFFKSFIIIKEKVTIMEIGPLKQTLLLWFGKIGRGNDFSPYLVTALISEENA